MAPSYAEYARELRDGHPEVSSYASKRLGELGLDGGPEEAIIVPAIGKNLDESNWRVRKAAADALGDLCTDAEWGRLPSSTAARAIPELIARLADTDCRVRLACGEPLERLRISGKLGENSDIGLAAAPAIPILIDKLKSDDWRVREVAVRAFGELDSASAMPGVPFLARLLADDGDRVRVAAKATLDKLHHVQAMPHVSMYGAGAVQDLTDRLHDSDWRVRCAASWALGQVGGCHAVGAVQLRRDLQDSDWAVRLLAVQALGEVGFSTLCTIPDISNRLRDTTDRVKHAAVEVFAKQQDALTKRSPMPTVKVRRLVAMALNISGGTVNRSNAIDELGKAGFEAMPAIPDLMRIITTEKDRKVFATAETALDALGKQGVLGDCGEPPPPRITGFGKECKPRPRAEVVKKMMGLMEDENWAVRLGAAEGLANLAIRAARVIPRLQNLAADEDTRKADHRLSQTAKKMIERLEEEGAMMDIDAVLEEAVPELLERAEDEDTSVRDMVKDVIERLQKAGLVQENLQDGQLEEQWEEEEEESEEEDDYDYDQEEELRRAAEQVAVTNVEARAAAMKRAKDDEKKKKLLNARRARRGDDESESVSEDLAVPKTYTWECNYCSRTLKETSNFCSKCGKKRPEKGWPCHSDHPSRDEVAETPPPAYTPPPEEDLDEHGNYVPKDGSPARRRGIIERGKLSDYVE